MGIILKDIVVTPTFPVTVALKVWLHLYLLAGAEGLLSLVVDGTVEVIIKLPVLEQLIIGSSGTCLGEKSCAFWSKHSWSALQTAPWTGFPSHFFLFCLSYVTFIFSTGDHPVHSTATVGESPRMC